MKSNFKKLAINLQVLSEPNRLKIVDILFANHKICVTEVAKKLHLSVAIASYHLQSLSQAGLVYPMREGKRVCYKPVVSELLTDLRELIVKYK